MGTDEAIRDVAPNKKQKERKRASFGLAQSGKRVFGNESYCRNFLGIFKIKFVQYFYSMCSYKNLTTVGNTNAAVSTVSRKE